MSIKDLMVHLDQSERTSSRLALAVSLARRYQARLTGVFGQLAHSQQIGVVTSWPTPEYAAAAQASKEAFEAATTGLPGAEWHDINRGSETELVRRVTERAHHADLVVMGQYDDQAKSVVPPDLTEEVVLHSGRPVLVIPYIGNFSHIAVKPLVAWSNSREAARALNDALPLMEGCEKATVMTFAANGDEARHACDHVIKHLASHGIRAESQAATVNDVGIMDMLLNATTDLGTDLLVMGAHGHSALPFMGRGAGTRYILRHMTVPVLMSS
jgi:nucleotide-binding universal stress UspA family protein